MVDTPAGRRPAGKSKSGRRLITYLARLKGLQVRGQVIFNDVI